MSLHHKIISWLVIFTALTIGLFGLGDYIQSNVALRFALETRASSLADHVAIEVERGYERAEAELLALGYAAAAGATSTLPELKGYYADVRVLRSGRVIYDAQASGAEPFAAPGCATGDIRFDVQFTDATGTPHRVEARTAALHFFAALPSVASRLGRRGLTSIARTEDGSIIFDSGCAIAADPDAHTLVRSLAAAVMAGAEAETGVVTIAEMPEASSEWVLAEVRMSSPPWTALSAVNYETFAAPFAQLRRQYFGVVSAVMLLAFLIMMRGIRRDVRRLAAISSAADAIGLGRFDVWLPPPTSDEVGRLSLALGRMMQRLSSTLRQVEVSRSMAAVGELSTYLSHEIRNPLSSVRLNLQMLQRDLRSDTMPEDGAEMVDLCLSELQRLDDVVRTVLEVGKTSASARGACDAHAVLQETMRVMERKVAAKGVQLEVRPDSPEATVAMNSAALRGIVMNLVLNSVDALTSSDADGGRISITTQLIGTDDPRFEMRVADNGPGVPAHLRERVFDPFFTTKHNGNGIGLPTALRAIQECGGTLRYEPSASWGSGAEFVLELPLADAPVAGPAPLAEAGA